MSSPVEVIIIDDDDDSDFVCNMEIRDINIKREISENSSQNFPLSISEKKAIRIKRDVREYFQERMRLSQRSKHDLNEMNSDMVTMKSNKGIDIKSVKNSQIHKLTNLNKTSKYNDKQCKTMEDIRNNMPSTSEIFDSNISASASLCSHEEQRKPQEEQESITTCTGLDSQKQAYLERGVNVTNLQGSSQKCTNEEINSNKFHSSKGENFIRKRKLNLKSTLPGSTPVKTIITQESDNSEPTTFHDYSKFFLFLLRSVRVHYSLDCMISHEEKNIINLFCNLKSPAQELYLYIYNRKFTWHRIVNLKYPNDLLVNVDILQKHAFFTTDITDVPSKDLLLVLKASELKEFAKSLDIKVSCSRSQLIERITNILQMQKTSRTYFNAGRHDVVQERLKKIVGPCLRLCVVPWLLFRKIEILFSFHNKDPVVGYKNWELLHHIDSGEVKFPQYVVDKNKYLFSTREEFQSYMKAAVMKLELMAAMEKKKEEAAFCLLKKMLDLMLCILSNENESGRVSRLEPWLNYFTPGAVYAYSLSRGMHIIKKFDPSFAINVLETLVRQQIYVKNYRGRWYEDLAILYKKSQNYKELPILLICSMRDIYTNELYKHKLSRHCSKLTKMKVISEDVKESLRKVIQPGLSSPITTVITAKSVPSNMKGVKRRMFVSINEVGEKLYSTVEDVALNYYKEKGYTQGLHGENVIPLSFFGLIFWDIIYTDYVPNVFISPYQEKPLDLSSGYFYINRKDTIEKRLTKLYTWNKEDIDIYIQSIYNNHKNERSIVDWNTFHDAENLLGMIHCIGWRIVLKLCERVAKYYTVARSGFPDLVVWKPKTNMYKFVEVKSPEDKVAPNQELWLHFLVSIDANVELCSIITVGCTPLLPERRENLDHDDDVDNNNDCSEGPSESQATFNIFSPKRRKIE